MADMIQYYVPNEKIADDHVALFDNILTNMEVRYTL